MRDYIGLNGTSNPNQALIDELQGLQLEGQSIPLTQQIEQMRKQNSELMKAKSMVNKFNDNPSAFNDMEIAYVEQIAPQLGLSIEEGLKKVENNKPGFLDISLGKNNKGGGLQGLLGGGIDSLLFDLIPDNLYVNRANKKWATGGKWASAIGSLALGGYGLAQGLRAANGVRSFSTLAKTGASVSDDVLNAARKVVLNNSDDLARALGSSTDDIAKLATEGSFDDIVKTIQSGKRASAAQIRELNKAIKTNNSFLRKTKTAINKNIYGNRQKLVGQQKQNLLSYGDEASSAAQATTSTGPTAVSRYVNRRPNWFPKSTGEQMAERALEPSFLARRGGGRNAERLTWTELKKMLGAEQAAKNRIPVNRSLVPRPSSVGPYRGIGTGVRPREWTFAGFKDDIVNSNKLLKEQVAFYEKNLGKLGSVRSEITAAQKFAKGNAAKILKSNEMTLTEKIGKFKTLRTKKAKELKDLLIDAQRYGKKDIGSVETLSAEVRELNKIILRLNAQKIASSANTAGMMKNLGRDLANFGSLTTGQKIGRSLVALPAIGMTVSPAVRSIAPLTPEALATGSMGNLGGIINPSYSQNRLNRLPLYNMPTSPDQEEVEKMLTQ